MDSFEQFRLFRLKHAEMIGTGIPVYNCRCVITPITKDTTMTEETKPVPHVHQAKINEWAADPKWPWQYTGPDGKWHDIVGGRFPNWDTTSQYRRKPRWFDMEQEWIARGKPPVEYISKIRGGVWATTHDPIWRDSDEYRFKEVSRHAALKAEWEAKGRPERQYQSKFHTEWQDIEIDCHTWAESCDYRIKPTPHPCADVLRALADDGSVEVEMEVGLLGGSSAWIHSDLKRVKLRIKP